MNQNDAIKDQIKMHQQEEKLTFKVQKEDSNQAPLTVKLKSNWRFESGISTMVSDTPFLCSIPQRPKEGARVFKSHSLSTFKWGGRPATNSTQIKLNESPKMTNKTRNIWWIVRLQRSSTKANIWRTISWEKITVKFCTTRTHIILDTMDDSIQLVGARL